MVSKVLALAVIVAAVGAVAVETPLAGKSESGIESPAARSAEYEDARYSPSRPASCPSWALRVTRISKSRTAS
jgi:hypothetical protein